MKGKELFLGSVKEASSYDADTFMIFTGAPQNTKRRPVSELRIEEGLQAMADHGITQYIIHAPYIINLGNTINEDTYQLGVEFLTLETRRCAAMGCKTIVLHPGAHVGAGAEAGIAQIARGLNEVLSTNPDCVIALETMAGKGSEIGGRLEELAAIYELVHRSDRLRICLDTCHLHDAGYPVAEDFSSILTRLEALLGKNQVAALHVNDSKNPQGAAKDRHANIGDGAIGLKALRNIVQDPYFAEIPKILETPYRASSENPDLLLPPYKEEILLLKEGS